MSETEEKKHKASDRKLRKQREEGSVPSARESSGLLSGAAGFAVIAALFMSLWSNLTEPFAILPDLITLPFDEAKEVALTHMLRIVGYSLFPVILIVLGVAVLSTLILNKGVVFAMKPVLPDLQRVSMVAGFKRVYGKQAFIEVTISIVRLLLWLGFCGIVIAIWLPSVVKSVECDLYCLSGYIVPMIKYLVIGAIFIMIIFAAADILVKNNGFMTQQRMTDTERKRERKDQSGSPEVRKERNRLKNEMKSGSSTPMSFKDTTILFYGESGVVGICYRPPEIELPVITARAKVGKKAEDYIVEGRKNRISLAYSEELVKGSLTTPPGGALSGDYFKAFAKAYAVR